MGQDRRDERPKRGNPLIETAQVVPEVPTFSVDDGFRYAVPPALSGIEVGAVVRVPLGGRRVRGYVVSISTSLEGSGSLKEIAAVSGDVPIFDRRLLGTMRWLAIHYVAPVAGVLAMAAPPNLPRRTGAAVRLPDVAHAESPLPAATNAAAAGLRVRPQYLVHGGPHGEVLGGLVADVARAGRSSMIVMPTVPEAEAIGAGLRRVFGDRVVLVHSGLGARSVTASWVRAATEPGLVVVGTREIALWPVASLALSAVVEEGRRAMKSPQTPTVHVREVLRRRAASERFQLVFVGAVPTLEAVAAGVETIDPPGRVWPLVEMVDRTEDPPGSGFVTGRARHALSLALRQEKRVFVLVNRRGYAPAFRCVRCRAVRRCGVCGAAADRGDTCRRCGAHMGTCRECGAARFEPLGAGVGRIVDELRAIVGEAAAPAGEGAAPILVGTERDLATVGGFDLTVAVDADGALYAPNYRASEDALRLLARLASKVRPGRGNRAVIQTSMPNHEVFGALRGGHPLPFLAAELAHREEEGFPPAAELMAVEIRGDATGIDGELRDLVDGEVLGPAPAVDATRWLVQAPGLRESKVRLRRAVQQWRDKGLSVRIDADPQDL